MHPNQKIMLGWARFNLAHPVSLLHIRVFAGFKFQRRFRGRGGVLIVRVLDSPLDKLGFRLGLIFGDDSSLVLAGSFFLSVILAQDIGNAMAICPLGDHGAVIARPLQTNEFFCRYADDVAALDQSPDKQMEIRNLHHLLQVASVVLELADIDQHLAGNVHPVVFVMVHECHSP